MRITYKIILLTFLFQNNVFAWNDTDTHPTLSEYAAKIIIYPEFMEQSVNGQTVRDWIREGSEKEDDWRITQLSGTRSLSHFHAPNRPLDSAGLNGTIGLSAPLWAQDGSTQTGFVGGDWSWQAVRNHQYAYLTALTKKSEDDNLVNLLKGLGYQMHLIQDMSQPNHVRNDTHLPDGFGLTWWVNGLETWAKVNDVFTIRLEILDKKNPDDSPVFPVPDVQVDLTRPFADATKAPVARLFDTRAYIASPSPSTSLSQGLAEYTNANFFSENTSFAAERYTSDNRTGKAGQIYL